jgi:hypothetical protein
LEPLTHMQSKDLKDVMVLALNWWIFMNVLTNGLLIQS